jgi:hypothetical protein
MNMTCAWVRADDGALVMKWTKAADPEVSWGTDGQFERLLVALDARDLVSVTPQLKELTVPTLVVWGTGGRRVGLLAA